MSQPQPLQSISIPRYETRSSTNSCYIVYAIVVQLPVRSWTVYRRYSEFVRLDQNLLSPPIANGSLSLGREPGGAGRSAPLCLPAKQRTREWKKTFSGFLGRSTSSSLVQDRDTEEEMFLRERKQSLELYLKAIVMSESQDWRESDAFKRFIEWPQGIKMATAIVIHSSSPPPHTSSSGTTTGRIDNATAVNSLSSNSFTQQQQQRLVQPNNTATATKASPSPLPGTFPSRALGTAATKLKAEETEWTRPLSNTQLYDYHNESMNQQDQQLGNLASILQRQRQMGEAIHQELCEQNELLSQLDTEVETTKGKLDHAEQKMDKLDGGKARRKVGGR